MEVVDATNAECPEPFMKTVAKLMSIKSGSVKVLFKDPKCVDMIKEAINLMNCKIIELTNQNGVYLMIIEKGEDSKEIKDVKLGGC
ncbi:sulfurtransferase TusA family protein [Sulfurisphaera tokodaii]|uniref:UPF0033 domain-containing protein n=2 Tax=Sulfurisphaera tokodaii TaxID=111955 RepID=Q96ZE3_SULTO|nr:sulfurtransferase TusA family protein [Sulfurisphaera tokodaii]BAB66982.1 hypothetical protein STK_18895 [Sulfurisphaera tokodaii str. 7]HII75363.1 sulfurtransferase TusA family protein [Sulfurisphaera tokodaii]